MQNWDAVSYTYTLEFFSSKVLPLNVQKAPSATAAFRSLASNSCYSSSGEQSPLSVDGYVSVVVIGVPPAPHAD